ncbi:polysaccharide pyruvyl transferase family protein [Vibrio alginolyticus]|uniref:polysaccharide pyruvyl transferase family protein n=1 Tax=Vibrio alginolyticus TaxID=663 RepID=UPI001BD2B681|nr:polysaccharide pyruvyl transferase family protein [Vibrio alginolyticus]MBS9854713.1 polysaccharide pyruvyl transferase family protein [Vibrio alginolyticus]
MKTVGIVTIHDIYNYGSILQATATQVVVEKLGFKAEIIDYKYPNKYHTQSVSLSEKYKKLILKSSNEFLKNRLPEGKTKVYKRRYADFKNKHYNLSKKTYLEQKSLKTSPPKYDIYMTGSDQVWRPDTMKCDSNFFLEFAGNAKKVAFASSFGCISLDSEYTLKYQKYLASYDYIGVREASGVDLVEELTGTKPSLVLDPTLLLDSSEWSNYIRDYPNTSYDYILVYGDNTHDHYTERLAKHISEVTGLKIIRINGKFYDYFSKDMKFILDAGPAEWLSLFKNASLILGQSFHATAFAINFERPFYAILRGSKNHDARQLHLLETLGLGHRAITCGDEFPLKDELNLDVDYSEVSKVMNIKRMESIDFLKNALS